MFCRGLPIVIGLPITKKSAPLLIACRGLVVLFCSSLLFFRRIPGTKTSKSQHILFTNLISLELQTIPSRPVFFAKLASMSTCLLTELSMPTSFKSVSEKEVKIVIPSNFMGRAKLSTVFLASRRVFLPLSK